MEDNQKPFREMSPDEVAESMKEKVGRGVGKAAQASGRFSEKADRANEKVTGAVSSTAEKTREIGGAAAQEAAKTKDSIRDAKQE
jgi:hypothetical protein